MRAISNVPLVIFDAGRAGILSTPNVPLVILDAERLGIRSTPNVPLVILVASRDGISLATSDDLYAKLPNPLTAMLSVVPASVVSFNVPLFVPGARVTVWWVVRNVPLVKVNVAPDTETPVKALPVPVVDAVIVGTISDCSVNCHSLAVEL